MEIVDVFIVASAAAMLFAAGRLAAFHWRPCPASCRSSGRRS